MIVYKELESYSLISDIFMNYSGAQYGVLSEKVFYDIINKYIKINERYLLRTLISSSNSFNYMFDFIINVNKKKKNKFITRDFIEYITLINIPNRKRIKIYEDYIKNHLINYYKVIPFIQKEILQNIIMKLYIDYMIEYKKIESNYKNIYLFISKENNRKSHNNNISTYIAPIYFSVANYIDMIFMNNCKIYKDQISILKEDNDELYPNYLLFPYKDILSYLQYINPYFISDIDNNDTPVINIVYNIVDILEKIASCVNLIILVNENDDHIIYCYNCNKVKDNINFNSNINDFVVEYNYYTNYKKVIEPYIMIDYEYNINFM